MAEANQNPGMTAAATKLIDRSLVKPTWIVLIVGWLIMLIPFPGTGLIGALVAGTAGFILAVVNLIRGVVGIGILQMICALIVTPIVYFITAAIYTAAMMGGA